MAINSLRRGTVRKVETLTSGSSWTVPANVQNVVVTLWGGGGGSGGVNSNSATAGGTGGTTTFTGATSALGGTGGAVAPSASASYSLMRDAVAPAANTGEGAKSPMALTGNPWTAAYEGGEGTNGQIITSSVATTPAASIAYSIGAGGTAGTGGGAAGGSGKIEIEYFV